MSAMTEQTTLYHYERALECGQNGLKQSLAENFKQDLKSLVDQATSLKWLEEQKEQVRLLLRREIHIIDCQIATGINTAVLDKAGSTQASWSKWWAQETARACDRLRQQTLPPGTDVFTEIEPWVCVLIMTGDSTAQIKVARLRVVVNDLIKQIENEIDDYGASKNEKYRNSDSKSVLKLQIEKCEDWYKKLDNPRLALQYCRNYIERGADLEQALNTTATSLENWISLLKAFDRDIGATLATINYALLTGDFTPAFNALNRSTGAPTEPQLPNTPQPGAAFITFKTHPTFQWLREQVENAKRRYDKQLAHKRFIEWGLPLESIQKDAELDSVERNWQAQNATAGSRNDEHAAFIRDLRSGLAIGKFPLERVLESSKAMANEEPDDSCRLQAQIVYTDPLTMTRYEGLDKVSRILETKVNQLQNLREWLEQFTVTNPQITVRRECPGIVNWAAEKPLIEKQRDTCQLKAALEHCHLVHNGDGVVALGHNPENLLVNGLWPLVRAKKSLENPPADLLPPKSSIARSFDAERQSRIKLLTNQIDECIKLRSDIEWRIKEQPIRWDKLLDALGDMRQVREAGIFQMFRRNQRIAETTETFKQACARYEQVCPCDPEFLKILDEEPRIYFPEKSC